MRITIGSVVSLYNEVVVMCQIIYSDRGYEGVIQNAQTNETVYNTGFQCCAEDAERLMENIIVRSKWKVVPNPINF